MFVRRFIFVFAVALLAVVAGCGDDDTKTIIDGSSPDRPPCGTEAPNGKYITAPSISFDSSGGILRVEVADDSEEQHTGLMNRDCLGDDWGMLFVYSGDVQSTFWMHDTFVPLTIAFIAADGTILELEDMQPQTEDQHQAPAPFRYAIEANQGWFAEHGIEAGDVATIPDNLSGS
jgi:hypothetical protein